MFVAGLALIAALFFFSESTPDPVGRGSSAPDFRLPTLTGGEVSLEELRGKVVFVNFWATWCKPCEDEMPAMERLYRAQRNSEFEMLAVSVDQDEADVREFQQRYQLSFPILLDPKKEVSNRYQAFRFPETFLVKPDGHISERFIGPREWDDPLYAQRVRELLEARP